MRKLLVFIVLSLFIFSLSHPMMEAKKIKSSFKIESKKASDSKNQQNKPSIEINLSDTLAQKDSIVAGYCLELKKCRFAGFEKEAASNVETFIFVNSSPWEISGMELKIDYSDMQGRMLHSRRVTLECEVPPGESRKFDIASWDKQHTYYYHLGNPPKRVATPFKVNIIPVTYKIFNE